MVSWPWRRRAATTTILPASATSCCDRVISSLLFLKSRTKRWPLSQSTPSTPSTSGPLMGSAGALTLRRLRGPTCSLSRVTIGLWRTPTTVWTAAVSTDFRSRRSISRFDTQLTLAPVSRRNLNGPCSLIVTGASICSYCPWLVSRVVDGWSSSGSSIWGAAWARAPVADDAVAPAASRPMAAWRRVGVMAPASSLFSR